jgi:hypothetical protein
MADVSCNNKFRICDNDWREVDIDESDQSSEDSNINHDNDKDLEDPELNDREANNTAPLQPRERNPLFECADIV